MMMHTGRPPAVVLFIHRRPEATRQVFAAIKNAQPERLFVIADGAKDDSPVETSASKESRLVTEGVNWGCEVTRIYSEVNMGCRNRIVSGLDEVFSAVEQAIILEDDCVPSLDFFRFASELLEHFRLEERVMSISGSLWHFPDNFIADSYWFSNYPAIWGWATWRRSWEHLSLTEATYPSLRESDWLEKHFGRPGVEAQYWRQQLDKQLRIGHTWDYMWTLAHWLAGSVSIRPSVNMIRNIGFDASATHTKNIQHPAAKRDHGKLKFPIKHLETMEYDKERDQYIEQIDHSGQIKQGLREVSKFLRNRAQR